MTPRRCPAGQPRALDTPAGPPASQASTAARCRNTTPRAAPSITSPHGADRDHFGGHHGIFALITVIYLKIRHGNKPATHQKPPAQQPQIPQWHRPISGDLASGSVNRS